jgi:hypothetical protein
MSEPRPEYKELVEALDRIQADIDDPENRPAPFKATIDIRDYAVVCRLQAQINRQYFQLVDILSDREPKP